MRIAYVHCVSGIQESDKTVRSEPPNETPFVGSIKIKNSMFQYNKNMCNN